MKYIAITAFLMFIAMLSYSQNPVLSNADQSSLKTMKLMPVAKQAGTSLDKQIVKDQPTDKQLLRANSSPSSNGPLNMPKSDTLKDEKAVHPK